MREEDNDVLGSIGDQNNLTSREVIRAIRGGESLSIDKIDAEDVFALENMYAEVYNTIKYAYVVPGARGVFYNPGLNLPFQEIL